MPLGRLSQWLLLAPALALLMLLFLIPIGWFIGGSLASLGGFADIWMEAKSTLGSPAILKTIINTNVIGLTVTVLVLVLGYPMSFALSRLKGVAFIFVLICIVLPYFTSIIVRTYAWMVLLGRNGVINNLLISFGIIDQPLALLYNRAGVVIGMTYVLLPYMVLTLFAAMKSVDMRLLQAAEGMGAKPFEVFRRVFLPLTMHGVMAGCLIVFILAIGFFITPALMGSPGDMMMAMLIEREIELAQNWPGAALMTLVLLAITLALYGVYARFNEQSSAGGF